MRPSCQGTGPLQLWRGRAGWSPRVRDANAAGSESFSIRVWVSAELTLVRYCRDVRVAQWRTVAQGRCAWLVAVFAVIAAVLLMHGVSGAHDLNASGLPAATVASELAKIEPSPHEKVLPGIAAMPMVGQHSAAVPATDPAEGASPAAPPSSGHHGDGAGGSCLGLMLCLVLFAGVAAAAIIALWRRCPARRVQIVLASMQNRTRMIALVRFGPPPRAPSLSSLCLLRT